MLETAAGLAFACGPWHVTVGYELADRFQLVDRLTFTDPLHSSAFTTTTADLGLDGVFVRVGFSY